MRAIFTLKALDAHATFGAYNRHLIRSPVLYLYKDTYAFVTHALKTLTYKSAHMHMHTHTHMHMHIYILFFQHTYITHMQTVHACQHMYTIA